ncbi:membrane protein [Psychromonas sp. PRT-SC03]|nr:membrane protein [Psychromonas sp. PRT-SC03]
MQNIKRYLLLIAGFISLFVGLIGIILPLLPTTPFVILALACFSRSSPYFQQRLLNMAYIGPILQDWQAKRCLSKDKKNKVMLLTVLTFAISIYCLSAFPFYQYMLLSILCLLLFFIRRIAEK